jgi:hypothetical protein
MDASVPLFTTAALAVLDSQQYDPEAKGSYELMSGALVWSDELPKLSEAWAVVAQGDIWRFLVAYRASVTLGKEQVAFRAVWEQVVQHAPNWPGLRPERRGDKARRRLLAAKRRSDRCLDELQRKFDEERASESR